MWVGWNADGNQRRAFPRKCLAVCWSVVARGGTMPSIDPGIDDVQGKGKSPILPLVQAWRAMHSSTRTFANTIETETPFAAILRASVRSFAPTHTTCISGTFSSPITDARLPPSPSNHAMAMAMARGPSLLPPSPLTVPLVCGTSTLERTRSVHGLNSCRVYVGGVG